MSVEHVDMYQIRCDGCGAIHEWYDEGVDALFASVAEAERFHVDGGWTTDGESKHHCDACEALELTEAARAERSREIGPNDVSLIEVSES